MFLKKKQSKDDDKIPISKVIITLVSTSLVVIILTFCFVYTLVGIARDNTFCTIEYTGSPPFELEYRNLHQIVSGYKHTLNMFYVFDFSKFNELNKPEINCEIKWGYTIPKIEEIYKPKWDYSITNIN